TAENPNLRCRAIDIDEKTSQENILKEINRHISDSYHNNYQTAYRDNIRYAQQLDILDPEKEEKQELALKKQGIYIITGGAGGIGFTLAEYLARKEPRIKIALLGRAKELSQAKKDIIKRIEKETGARINYYATDITDPNNLKRVIKKIKEQYPNNDIRGLVLSAGLAGDGFLIQKEETTFRQVISPKMAGTNNLMGSLSQEPLDLVLFCSSSTSVFPVPGQGDYTAANAYLDAWAKQGTITRNKGKKDSRKEKEKEVRQDNIKILSLNWSAWQEVGMAKAYGADKDEFTQAISPQQAVKALDGLLKRNISHTNILVGKLNYSDQYLMNNSNELFIGLSQPIRQTLDQKKKPSIIPKPSTPEEAPVALKGRKNKDYTQTEQKIAQVWHQVLGHKEYDINDNFFEIGGDSLKIIQVQKELDKFYPGKLSVARLFTYPTIAQLAGYLENSTDNKLIKKNNKIKELIRRIKEDELSVDEAIKDIETI
ncbi:MAG TPA: SDR family NAD(P)-dependent oxidoreductase, partial [Patescibacteria group bacterium]|nr:SDR family NAD(P)-dependent oxidoreductase [Patescibacteria group bacterium]